MTVRILVHWDFLKDPDDIMSFVNITQILWWYHRLSIIISL